MPDISMCRGEDCPKRGSCYRYTATPSSYNQSYFSSSPITTEDLSKAAAGFCGWFIQAKVTR